MRVLYRLLRASAAITGLLCVVAVGLAAQIPGRNVNIVSKDPYLQKQNEPSGAVGTLNPCHLLFGGNDYRTVNVPGLPGDNGDKEVGDAWVGVYESTDCGQTWLAGLMPGYPQDTSPEGTASPAHGFAAAADPTVKAGLAGFYAYSHIVFNRGSNLDREMADPVRRADAGRRWHLRTVPGQAAHDGVSGRRHLRSAVSRARPRRTGRVRDEDPNDTGDGCSPRLDDLPQQCDRR
jgi:hypothetical protein